jgi:hypothetical protein
MYEQVAKDQLRERLKQGVASQHVHRAIGRRERFSVGDKIVSWSTRHNESIQLCSQGNLVQQVEPDNLVTSEKPA